MHILLSCLQQPAVLPMAAMPFGLSVTVFWMYVCAALLLVIGVVKIVRELPQRDGLDKTVPFGRLFFAIPRRFRATLNQHAFTHTFSPTNFRLLVNSTVAGWSILLLAPADRDSRPSGKDRCRSPWYR